MAFLFYRAHAVFELSPIRSNMPTITMLAKKGVERFPPISFPASHPPRYLLGV